jgi:hypothetical protein
MENFLEAMGLHGPVLVAGFSGGVCYVVLPNGEPSPRTIISGIVVGTLTSNYLSTLAVSYLPVERAGVPAGTIGGAAAFIVGLCGPWICKTIIRRVKSRMERQDG